MSWERQLPPGVEGFSICQYAAGKGKEIDGCIIGVLVFPAAATRSGVSLSRCKRCSWLVGAVVLIVERCYQRPPLQINKPWRVENIDHARQ